MAMFKEMKAQEGQTNAFGKSMDAMAKAFPDQADMFNGLKMDVLDPNASLIERVSRMNQTRETLNMINQQRIMGMNQQYKNYQMSGAGAGGGAEAAEEKAKVDIFGPTGVPAQTSPPQQTGVPQLTAEQQAIIDRDANPANKLPF
jgi:hypothetical protein